MIPLTPLQDSILDVIRQYLADHGHPPTISQIGQAVGLASRDRVIKELRAIQFKGFIEPVGATKVRINAPQEPSHG